MPAPSKKKKDETCMPSFCWLKNAVSIEEESRCFCVGCGVICGEAPRRTERTHVTPARRPRPRVEACRTREASCA